MRWKFDPPSFRLQNFGAVRPVERSSVEVLDAREHGSFLYFFFYIPAVEGDFGVFVGVYFSELDSEIAGFARQ
jgi:hypothetical protein